MTTGVARPGGRDALVLRGVAQALRRLDRGRRLQLEAAGDPEVPQRQPHERRQFLPRQVVADDAVEPELAVLLGEAVLLAAGAAEVRGDGLRRGPGCSVHVDREQLDLPAVQRPATLRLPLLREDARHDAHIDRVVGAAVGPLRVAAGADGEDAQVGRGALRTGAAVRHVKPGGLTKTREHGGVLEERRPVEARDERQLALATGCEPRHVPVLPIHSHEHAIAGVSEPVADSHDAVQCVFEVHNALTVARRQVRVDPEARPCVLGGDAAVLDITPLPPRMPRRPGLLGAPHRLRQVIARGQRPVPQRRHRRVDVEDVPAAALRVVGLHGGVAEYVLDTGQVEQHPQRLLPHQVELHRPQRPRQGRR